MKQIGMAITLALLTMGIASATPVSINYTARIINLTQLNPGPLAALNDFLAQLGLSTTTGPTGTEIPISGTYTFEYPEPDQPGNGSSWGTYALTDFTINGISLLNPGPATYPRIDVILGSGMNQYYVGFDNGTAFSNDGATRSFLLQLGLTLPSGTFSNDGLPPNIDFFPLATGYETAIGATFRYFVQVPGQAGVQVTGTTRWLSADLASTSTPEPATFYPVAGVGALLLVRLRYRASGSIQIAQNAADGLQIQKLPTAR